MPKWEMVRLGDVCSKGSSSIAQKDLEHKNGIFPIYGASGFIKNVDFYVQDKEYLAVVKDGAGVGRVMRLPSQSSIIGTLQYIFPKENISITYLYYALNFMKLSKYFTGAAIPHIYFKDYQNEKLSLPPLEEQKKIAQELDSIQSLIAKRKEQLEKMDLLVKAKFVEMFGDKHIFECVKLDSVSKVMGGVTKNSKRNNLKIKMQYLRVANVHFNKLSLKDISEIGVEEKEIEKYTVYKDDLLIVEGNGSIEQIGRVAIWDGSIVPILHQNHLIKVRLNPEKIIPQFCLYYLIMPDGRRQIVKKSVSTSGLNTLSVKRVGELQIPLPSIDLQNKFADYVQQTKTLKTTMYSGLEKLELLYHSKMQEYFG